MKLISILFAMLSVQSVFAASLTCADIQQAEKDKSIVHSPFKAATKSLRPMILKRAAVVSGQYTEKQIRNLSYRKLKRDLDPIIDNVHIGAREFHSVNLNLGDNSFIYLFDLNTENYAGIASEDGTVVIDGEYCDTQEVDIL